MKRDKSICFLFEPPLNPEEWKGECLFGGDCKKAYDKKEWQKCQVWKAFKEASKDWKEENKKNEDMEMGIECPNCKTPIKCIKTIKGIPHMVTKGLIWIVFQKEKWKRKCNHQP